MEITPLKECDTNEVREQIRQIMSGLFKEDISDDFDRYKSEKWDSFAHLDLIVSLEEDFDISFTPEEIGSIFSLNDLVIVVNNKLHA